MKQVINVKVTIDDEVYGVDSCWSQETEEFCEKIANEVVGFIDKITSKSE